MKEFKVEIPEDKPDIFKFNQANGSFLNGMFV